MNMARPILAACLALSLGVSLTISTCASAQSTGTANPSGGTFLEIDDGQPRTCININKSVVSMFVTSVKARQNTSWLPSWIVATQDLGVKINLTLVDPASQDPAFTFPRAVQLRPVGSTNIVTLPIIFRVLTQYDLVKSSTNPPHPLSNITLDIDFINMQGQTPLATAMTSLINFSSNLPVPPNPYVTGVQLFGKFANSLIAQAATGSSDQSPLAEVSYDLSVTDTCQRLQLVSGTTGLIFDYDGNDLSRIIKTADSKNYCYEMADGQQVNYFKKPQPNLDCAHQTGVDQIQRTTLNNPQIIFTVNAYLRQNPVEVAQVTSQVALQRCRRSGISAAQCL